MTATPLKLYAFDAEDLAVLSAHLQDAVLKASDMAFLARERRFALVCDRFDWTAASDGVPQRRRAGLRLERVTAVKVRGVPKGDDKPLALLAINYAPAGPDSPDGTVELVFAGNAALRLSVECIEAAMDDLGSAWAAEATPRHD